MTLEEQIRQLAKQFHPRIIELRREIHANPELAFEEIKTGALVAETLRLFGVEVKTGVART